MPASWPTPTTTFSPVTGKRLRKCRLDLYEQCSLHWASNACSSTTLGSRPRATRIRSISSGRRLTADTTALGERGARGDLHALLDALIGGQHRRADSRL